MKNTMKLALAAAVLFCASTARAQYAPPTPLPSSVLCNTCQTSLSVTATTGHVALPSTNPPYNTLTIYNAGTKDAFFVQGVSATAATTSNVRIPAGGVVEVWVSGTYLAAITGGADTTTLYLYQSNGPIDLIIPASGSTVSGTVTSNQGTANTAANGWPVKITDGTNTADVKAASTLPALTDKALVTTQRDPLPAGTNSIGSVGNTSFAAPVADGANVTLGAKADAAAATTDNTPITVMSVLKQVSKSIQAWITTPSVTVSNTGFTAQGPTAVGSAASTPPVITGGTVDGTATGVIKNDTVKAASTPAAATDTARVVVLRDAIPAGTSSIGNVGTWPWTAVAGTQTSLSVATAQALTVPATATIAVITPECTSSTTFACVRYRDDGSNPTAGAGQPLSAGSVLVYKVTSLPIKFITATGGVGGVITVSYYKPTP